MILLLATLGFACEPIASDTLDILVEDQATDVPPLARLGVRLGDVQQSDPDLTIVLTDGDDTPLPLDFTSSFHNDEDGTTELRMLVPEAPLVPGETYTLVAESFLLGEQREEVSFTVGEGDDPPIPDPPNVAFRTHRDVITDDDNMCTSDHRLLEITLDTGGVADAMTLVHLWTAYEGEPVPNTNSAARLVSRSNGNPRTVRAAVQLRDEVSCVTAVAEDILGQRSDPMTVCYDGPEDVLREDDAGCACSTAEPSPTLALVLAPLLLGLARRRRR